MVWRTSGAEAGERLETSLEVVNLQGLEYRLDKVGLVRCRVGRCKIRQDIVRIQSLGGLTLVVGSECSGVAKLGGLGTDAPTELV